ncbi:MAG TPA: ABC transporter permease [Coriobacteriia bacterium]|nr:ABC transporter permease [Coriobacteriia bacterium]
MSWKRIKLLIWKEFTQLKRDKSMLPILFIMPVIQLILFGYVVGSDVRNLRMAVLDQDGTAVSRRIADAFSGSGYFKIVDRPTSEAELKDDIDGGKVVVAVVIPRGTGNSVKGKRASQVQIIVDGSDSRASQVASSYSQGVISNLSNELYPSAIMKRGSPAGVDARVRVLYNPTMRAVNTMVPALLAFILMMSVQNTMSQAIVKERERGTLEQIFVTPISRGEYLLGKLLPYAAVAVIQVIVTFIVGTLWFRVPFRGSVVVLGFGLMLFMFSALGLGMIISLTSTTRQQAQQMAMFLQLPTMMLSGFMFPIEAFPRWLYALTYAIPLRYALVIVRSNFLKGSTISTLWMQFMAMAVFSVLLFLFGLTRFRKRLAD